MLHFLGILLLLFIPFMATADMSEWSRIHMSDDIFFQNRLRAEQMSPEELAGHVIMPAFEKGTSAEKFGVMLCQLNMRSYIILRADSSAALVQRVQKAYQSVCGTDTPKLLVALDAEPSLMKYRMKNVKVGNTNTLRSTSTIVAAAENIAEGLVGAGIRLNFAPVYDVNTNKTIIADRSFGSGTDSVSQRANLFANTLLSKGVIPTAKHFPGHGLAKGDTHKTKETISGTLQELPAFISAIEAGIPVIMVGHMVVKGGEWDSARLPSTLSKRIITDLLKNKLGFKGVVITDSMAMGALSGQKDRTVRALIAGADMVLIPVDPKAAHERVVENINSDSAFRSRVIDAASKTMALFE